MVDNPLPSELVDRLQTLRIKRGLTIQQMAEICGLPKSSLESYMRFDNVCRPGADALLAIANGMDVTIDWLVGRSEDSFPANLTEKDYAMSCFSVVQGVINWMRARQNSSDGSIFGKRDVAGVPDEEVAAKSMLIFVDTVKMFRDTANVEGEERRAFRQSHHAAGYRQ